MDLAWLTASDRLTRPICLRFIFDGLGSLATHSGTGDPDCSSTFAMLGGSQWMGGQSFPTDTLTVSGTAHRHS